MPMLLRSLIRRVTYTRLLHVLLGTIAFAMWLFVMDEHLYVPFALMALVGLIPAARLVEGLQARLLLTPFGYRDPASGIAAAPSRTWADRGRTVVWLEVRMVLGLLTGYLTVNLLGLCVDLARGTVGAPGRVSLIDLPGGSGWPTVLAPLPLVVLAGCVVWIGELAALLARRLLGPSAQERLTALEERTEDLLERNRIARELHDSIGHALTVAVVQAGAAKAAGSAEFTERALTAIEETGRAALEDLERVLRVLRESGAPPSARPSLADTGRLLESARASGAAVDMEVTGPVERVPGPVSREGYRILQESLTNVLRHAGPVPTRVRIAVTGKVLELEVVSPLREPARPGRGSGLRGIRERAALLGGEAVTGPRDGEWRVRVGLPLSGPA
ncbi:sensor histidine kinase [Streptomyces qinzhouensis]|uniref:histidine kinase n=1 Tax=Streptomyces qinzhouensis TaxID=2599401 RepID=A0A5B8JF33_9ACTN|nr:histidine kinase [Streptomyces qinzhouensis]QDY80076.1 two-component sensor histidine kinase [Streptomyces qinzhouensis]